MLVEMQLGKYFKNHQREGMLDRISYVVDVYELMADKYGSATHPQHRPSEALDVEWVRVAMVRSIQDLMQPQTYLLGRAILPTGLVVPVPSTLEPIPTKVLNGESFRLPSLPSLIALKEQKVAGQAIISL